MSLGISLTDLIEGKIGGLDRIFGALTNANVLREGMSSDNFYAYVAPLIGGVLPGGLSPQDYKALYDIFLSSGTILSADGKELSDEAKAATSARAGELPSNLHDLLEQMSKNANAVNSMLSANLPNMISMQQAIGDFVNGPSFSESLNNGIRIIMAEFYSALGNKEMAALIGGFGIRQSGLGANMSNAIIKEIPQREDRKVAREFVDSLPSTEPVNLTEAIATYLATPSLGFSLADRARLDALLRNLFVSFVANNHSDISRDAIETAIRENNLDVISKPFSITQNPLGDELQFKIIEPVNPNDGSSLPSNNSSMMASSGFRFLEPQSTSANFSLDNSTASTPMNIKEGVSGDHRSAYVVVKVNQNGSSTNELMSRVLGYLDGEINNVI
jgi:hypothetical protein